MKKIMRVQLLVLRGLGYEVPMVWWRIKHGLVQNLLWNLWKGKFVGAKVW
jgi:hypothetical protein